MTNKEIGAVEVVPIAEKYIEGFHACLDSVARERVYLAFLKAPPLASTRAFVRSNIAQGVLQFIAVTGDERVVGWCDIASKTLKGFTHVGRLGMGVHRDFRGRGIGRRLLVASLEMAKQNGLERVELEVFASNLPAIQLYEKAGFVVEGVQNKARTLDDTYEDRVHGAPILMVREWPNPLMQPLGFCRWIRTRLK